MSDRPFPDLSKVRRVRIDDEPTPQQGRIARVMAEAANESREREGDTEHE